MYRVIKNRKRLYIVDDKEQVFYTPPDFVRSYIPSRDVLQEVADYWNEFGYDIKIIMEMEAKYTRRKTK